MLQFSWGSTRENQSISPSTLTAWMEDSLLPVIVFRVHRMLWLPEYSSAAEHWLHLIGCSHCLVDFSGLFVQTKNYHAECVKQYLYWKNSKYSMCGSSDNNNLYS